MAANCHARGRGAGPRGRCRATELRRQRLCCLCVDRCVFFFQAEDGIRDLTVTGVQTCALPICTRTSTAATSVRLGSRIGASRREPGSPPWNTRSPSIRFGPGAPPRSWREVSPREIGRGAGWGRGGNSGGGGSIKKKKNEDGGSP